MMRNSISPLAPKDGSGLSPDIHDAFLAHLRKQGLSGTHVFRLRRGSLHFAVWLQRAGIAVQAVDDEVLRVFRHHDCTCPGMEKERRRMLEPGKRVFMTGALRLVRFLEDEGHIPHPGELHANRHHLDGFIARLRAKGYSLKTLGNFRHACEHVLVWLHRSRIPVADAGAQVLARFMDHDCICPNGFKSPRQRLTGPGHEELFLSFLRHSGQCHASLTPVAEPGPEPAMRQFEAWLRRHRGIGESSVRRHSCNADRLAADLGPDAGTYSTAAIRETLLRHYAGVSGSQARCLAGSMRMYLRFLASTGACAPSLADAVPSAPTWRLAPLPRHIGPEQVEQVINCCDHTKSSGLRDRAILLLLARLGLRAGDIAALRLGDIDWQRGLVRVCGKSGRQEALPLPQDAGDAILEYIEKARPRMAADQVFLTVHAPLRPFASGGAVTHIVGTALKRAGLHDVRPQGAYLFRHSVATNMLRSGHSLETIGALLRHRSMDTTTIYAKTDTTMLLEIAQPWIGGGS